MATKVETNIHKRGQGSPLEAGEFNLRQLSIHSPSNPNPVLLDSPTSFMELCLYEDLFSNVLKGSKFSIKIFVSVAMVAIIRKILISSLKSDEVNAQMFLLVALAVLGAIFWIISKTEKLEE